MRPPHYRPRAPDTRSLSTGGPRPRGQSHYFDSQDDFALGLIGVSLCDALFLRHGFVRCRSRQIQRNVVPLPTSLEALIWPPDCLMKPYTMLKPRPVPCPGALVVKKGSKMRSSTSGDMPVPVSRMAIDVVAHSEPRMTRRVVGINMRITRLYGQRPAARHRIACVDRNVDQRGFQLDLIDRHGHGSAPI